MQAAGASGNISALLRAIVNSSKIKPEDFIKNTVGSLMYVYYLYLDTFKQKPYDLDDLIDGLLYVESRNYIQERQYEEVKARQDGKV